MGANSDFKDKWSAANEIRQGQGSKSSANNKKEEKPEVNYNRTRPKSSPEAQVKKPPKIPRLRPQTAAATSLGNNSNTKVHQRQSKYETQEKNLSRKVGSGLAQKKNENEGEQTTTGISTMKNTVKKVGENNAAFWNLNGFVGGNSNVKNRNAEKATVKPNPSVDEPNLTSTNVTLKLKDQRRKRNDTVQKTPDSNDTGTLKSVSSNSPKGTQGMKIKTLNNELPRKKSVNEKLKEALKEDFSYLLPLYQTEMRKVTDAWVNTIYGSLSVRSHFVKMVMDALPNINISQFQMEDERLLKCLAQAKACTEAEMENLIQFIKSLLKSQNLAKEECEALVEEKEIANMFSNDWSSMTKKLSGIAEETRKLQLAIPEEEKKKIIAEKKMKEKIREAEAVLAKKEEEINKLIKQLTILKKKEFSFRENIAMRKENFKEVEADIESLKKIEKEYHELKSTCADQYEMYKSKVDALESLLEEKKQTLAKEKQMKSQMQAILEQLQEQQQRLRNSIGSEQVDYIMGQTPTGREKSRGQLWVAAIKLVLRGFLVQMKKLECDKNKMLLHIQEDDFDNFKNTAATIVKKEQFMKSIVGQMIDFHKSYNHVNVENCDNLAV